MKYFSEITKKCYDTIEECENSEAAFLKEKNDKETAEKEAKEKLDELYSSYQMTVNDIHTMQRQANKDFSELETAVKNFIRKYGYIPDKYKNLIFFSTFTSLL